MPRYIVTVTACANTVVRADFEVEAANEAEARANAVAEANEGGGCWELGRGYDLDPDTNTFEAQDCEVLDGTEDIEEGTDDE